MKGPKYRKVRPVDLEKAKCCILKVFLNACQVFLVKTVLINVSFRNGSVMLPTKLMKESLI